MKVIQDHDPYYAIDGFQLYHGNSLELLSRIPEESVDMIFADPPYGLSNGGFTCQGGQRVAVHKGDWDKSKGVEQDFAFHQKWIAACHRVLKPGGTIWVSGSYHSIFACGYALQMAEFKLLNDIAWYKPNGAPNLSCRYFTASHETLLWARKGQKSRHTFNYDEMKHGEWHNNDRLKKPNKQMRSVWSLSTARGEETRLGKHPTQKPMALLERIVLASTEPGDLVLDPFAGSSTTGIAALKHGRRFVGMDIDEEYLDLSQRRADKLWSELYSDKEPLEVSERPPKAPEDMQEEVVMSPSAKKVIRRRKESRPKDTSKASPPRSSNNTRSSTELYAVD
ncbi:MAG: site-specific DNA-methyltransferase [Deltaproteobacteria bacterium]|nr:MAG: site-specific DNA-methyltransferase [Deltaproteobacteria bacterium]